MKSFFLLIISTTLALAAQAQKGFTINGKIDGKADGMKVYLRTPGWTEPPKTVDSAIIKNGRFTLKGAVAVPAQHILVIDRTPKGEKSSEKNWLATLFYLENSPITYAGHIDSLPTYYYNSKRVAKPPVIKGSATEDESAAFKASLTPLRKALGEVDKEYLEVYHKPALEGKFNTKEGMELAKKETALNKEVEAIKWKYIADHPKSVVAYDQAMNYFMGMFVELTVPQIDSLVALVAKGWAGTPQMEKITAAAEKAKHTAIGTKYQDFELVTTEGKKVMLSQYVPKGKYVMLEFWASWCGPCRGEIPHLREVNKHKAENFELVSISLDDSEADWKKAMEEEAMVWTQLADLKGFEAEIAKAYNIMGIPFSLLLDKEGHIIEVNVRGARLDVALENL